MRWAASEKKYWFGSYTIILRQRTTCPRRPAGARSDVFESRHTATFQVSVGLCFHTLWGHTASPAGSQSRQQMWSFLTASTQVNVAFTSTSRSAPLRRFDFSRRCNEVYCFAADRQVHPTPTWHNTSTHGNISWTQIVKQVMYVSDIGCIMFSQEQSTVSSHLFCIPAEGTIQSYVVVAYCLEFLQQFCSTVCIH